MDDSNYKMKNMYSSVSPSEIALRCTILDLCQRLKRTEVLCDYYEQCRNELVSDCIRLRQERDYYLVAHRSQLQKSDAAKLKRDTATNNSNNIPVDANFRPKLQPNFQFEKEIDFPKNVEAPEENYEEIAKRLIKQFREEMEEIRRASISAGGGPDRGDQDENTDDDGIVTNNGKSKTVNLTKGQQVTSTSSRATDLDEGGYSKLNLSSHAKKEHSSASNRIDNEGRSNVNNYDDDYDDDRQTDPMVIYDVLEDHKGRQDHDQDNCRGQRAEEKMLLPQFDGSSAYYKKKSVMSVNGLPNERDDQREAPTIIEVNSGKDIYANPTELMGTTTIAASEANQYIELCNRLLKSSITDFDTLTKMLLNQNEKLRRLKGKQLRSYFKRQLDQNNETIGNVKRS